MSVREDIVKIYVGYFGRSPDPEGLDYWISEHDRGFSLPEIAASFSVQPESTSRYPYLENPNVADPAQFVTSVYQNLFNRDPEQSGLDYWVNELEQAQGNPVAVGSMVLNIISGALDDENGQDRTTIDNKTIVAQDWVQKAAEIPDFEYTTAAAASAQSVLDEVDDSTASVDEGIAETDAFIGQGAGQTANAITLTSDVDSGPEFVGTAGADRFNATAQTLNTGDDLDGAGGVDTLSVQFGNFQSVSATPRLANVENIEVQGGARDLNAQIDLTTSTGVQKVMLQDVNGEATQGGNFKARVLFEGVGEVVDIEIADSSTPNELLTPPPLTDLIVRYTDAATSGDGDTQRVTLSDSGLALFDVAGLSNLEVTAEGRNFVVEFNQVSQLTVDGAGDLVAGYTSTDTTATFNSVASTGDMAISFASGQQVVANAGSGNDNFDFGLDSVVDVSGGDGDDIFFFNGSGGLTEEDQVDGEGGEDTLAIDEFNSEIVDLVNGTSGMEVLMFQEPVSALTLSDFTEIDAFVFNGGPFNGTLSIFGIESDDRLIFTSDQGNSNRTLDLDAQTVGESLFLELRALPNGTLTPDFFIVEDGNVEIVTNGGSNNDVFAVDLDSRFSSVTVSSIGENEEANVIEAVDSGSDNYFAFGNDDGASSFEIVGNQALTIAAREGTELNESSDQSGFEDPVNVDASAFTGVLRIALSNGADVLTGGSAGDIIYGLGGDDRLTGNDGSDQFRYVGTNGEDTIVDFIVGDDKIGFNDVDFQNTAATFAGQVLDAADYVENRNGITDIGSADDDKMIELQVALSTNQIEADVGAEVEAYVLVYNSTTGRGEIWHDTDWSNDNNRDRVATLDNVVDLVGVQGFGNADFVEFIA